MQTRAARCTVVQAAERWMSYPAWYAPLVTREERAAQRRAQWAHGLVTSAASANLDRSFWSQASAAQRLEAVWQMAKQWSKNENPHGPTLRLDRSAFGVRRRAR